MLLNAFISFTSAFLFVGGTSQTFCPKSKSRILVTAVNERGTCTQFSRKFGYSRCVKALMPGFFSQNPGVIKVQEKK